MSRLRKLGLPNGQGYFKRIKDFTDAWQTIHNENIALKDIEQYDEELFGQLSCLSDSLFPMNNKRSSQIVHQPMDFNI